VSEDPTHQIFTSRIQPSPGSLPAVNRCDVDWNSHVYPGATASGDNQLGYLEPKADLAIHYLTKRYWFSSDYKRFGMIASGSSKPSNLLIWYTDGAQRKLRWTCFVVYVYPRRLRKRMGTG